MVAKVRASPDAELDVAWALQHAAHSAVPRSPIKVRDLLDQLRNAGKHPSVNVDSLSAAATVRALRAHSSTWASPTVQQPPPGHPTDQPQQTHHRP